MHVIVLHQIVLGGRARESVCGLLYASFVPFLGNLSNVQTEVQVLS